MLSPYVGLVVASLPMAEIFGETRSVISTGLSTWAHFIIATESFSLDTGRMNFPYSECLKSVS